MTEKVFKGTIIQEALFVFNKDESFSIFDCEASTVTFNNITFAFGHIITMAGTINIFTLQGNTK
jgi:hypothetical protein